MSAPPPHGTLDARPNRQATLNEESKSIEDQLTVCRTIAERHGWVEVGALRSVAGSGAATVGRAGLFDMLATACGGEFDVVLVEDLSRLSRSASHADSLQNELEAPAVTVHAADVGVTSEGSS